MMSTRSLWKFRVLTYKGMVGVSKILYVCNLIKTYTGIQLIRNDQSINNYDIFDSNTRYELYGTDKIITEQACCTSTFYNVTEYFAHICTFGPIIATIQGTKAV